MVVAVSIRSSSGQKRKPLTSVCNPGNREPKRQVTLEYFNFKGPQIVQRVKAEPQPEPIVKIEFSSHRVPAPAVCVQPRPTQALAPSQATSGISPPSSSHHSKKAASRSTLPQPVPVGPQKPRLEVPGPTSPSTLPEMTFPWFVNLTKAFLDAPDIPPRAIIMDASDWGTLEGAESYSLPIRTLCCVGLFTQAATQETNNAEELLASLAQRDKFLRAYVKGNFTGLSGQVSPPKMHPATPNPDPPTNLPGITTPWVADLAKAFLNAPDIPSKVTVSKTLDWGTIKNVALYSDPVRNLCDMTIFRRKAEERVPSGETFQFLEERYYFLEAYTKGLVVPSDVPARRLRAWKTDFAHTSSRSGYGNRVKSEPEDLQLPDVSRPGQSSASSTGSYPNSGAEYRSAALYSVNDAAHHKKQILYHDHDARAQCAHPQSSSGNSILQTSLPPMQDPLPPMVPKLTPIVHHEFRILTPSVYQAYYTGQELQVQRAAAL